MRTDRTGISSMVILLVVVLVVAATVLFAVTSQQKENGSLASSSTYQSTSPTTTSATNSSFSVLYGSTSQSSRVNQTLPVECSNISYPSVNGDVLVGTNSPAIICLQLYYYDPFAPLTLNMTAFLDIYAVQYGNGTVRSFDGDSNFTFTASQDQLVLGGPTNENEGVVVAVAITAKQGASGTYELNLRSQVQGGLYAFRLGGGSVEICGDYGEITAGNGMPDYSPGIHCSISIPNPSPWKVPGLPYDLDSGNTYFRIIAEGNSAG
jgi:hypothetical protein